MINKIRIKNYKSIKDSGLVDLGKFNVIIGSNNSGKSNFLEVLKVVRDLARGKNANDACPDFSLSKKNLFFQGKSEENIQIFLNFSTNENNKIYNYKFEISLNDSKTKGEFFEIPYEMLCEANGSSNEKIYERHGAKVDFLKNQELPIKIDKEKILLSYYDQDLLFQPLEALKSSFQITHTDIDDDNSSHVSVASVNLKKVNHLAVQLKRLGEEKLEKAIDSIKRVIPYFDGVEIIDIRQMMNREKKNNLDEIYIVYWLQRKTKILLESATLSSGDKRTIYIILALFFLSKNSTISIEEVENGIHVGRLGSLIDQIRTQTNNRNLQIILTTHNREVLDFVVPREVIYCKYSDPSGSQYTLLNQTETFNLIKNDLRSNATAKEVFDTGFFN